MKRLMLLRHAKAEAKEAQRDFDRVLAPRGRHDMEGVAAYLEREALMPDLALVSPAARTRETWQLARLPEVPARLEPGIYEASLPTLLGLVQGADEAVASLMLVGHNPGIEELAAALVEPDRRQEVAAMPTAALAVIAFEAATWRGVAPGTGRLERFATPATLEA